MDLEFMHVNVGVTFSAKFLHRISRPVGPVVPIFKEFLVQNQSPWCGDTLTLKVAIKCNLNAPKVHSPCSNCDTNNEIKHNKSGFCIEIR